MRLSSRQNVMSLLVVVFAIVSVPLFAQTSALDPVSGSETPKIPPPAYGTSSTIDYVVGGLEFHPYNSTSQPLTAVNGGLRRAGTNNAYYDAAVHLPAGALVVGIEIQGCDFSATNQILADIIECDTAGCAPRGTVVTGVAFTGCAFYANNAITPFKIDNSGKNYIVEINLADLTNSFTAMRVFYKLQVSPAPGTATFTDVPTTHLFYQYIEALAASGITSGCGGGNYCPDTFLTRGQMAVFLSKALGLHWPN